MTNETVPTYTSKDGKMSVDFCHRICFGLDKPIRFVAVSVCMLSKGLSQIFTNCRYFSRDLTVFASMLLIAKFRGDPTETVVFLAMATQAKYVEAEEQ